MIVLMFHVVQFGRNLEQANLTLSRTFLSTPEPPIFQQEKIEMCQNKCNKTSEGQPKYVRTYICLDLLHSVILGTPYSTNSLFSEFFREFSGIIVRVLATICGCSGGHVGSVLGSCWNHFGMILVSFLGWMFGVRCSMFGCSVFDVMFEFYFMFDVSVRPNVCYCSKDVRP